MAGVPQSQEPWLFEELGPEDIRQWVKLVNAGSRKCHGGVILILTKLRILNLACCKIVEFCSVFKTVIVFALGPFLPMSVVFFDFNGNFNGKMAKIYFLAMKSSRSVLQPSSYHC